MTINGIDTNTEFGVREWNLEKSYADISDRTEKPSGWLTPFLLPSEAGLKTMKVTVMITGDRRADWEKGTAIVGKLLDVNVVQFNDFPDRFFKCVLTNAAHAETCLRRWHKATLDLVGYEYGAEQSVTFTGSSYTIANPGSLASPCDISVKSSSALTALTMYGVARDPYTGVDSPITFNTLPANTARVINSVAGTVKEGGANKMELTDMLQFPSLLPGSNTIRLDRSGITTVITFRPYYV